MGFFTKQKCDVDKLKIMISAEMESFIRERFMLTAAELEMSDHSQGIDIIFRFVKKDLSPIKKKVSYQVKLKDLDGKYEETVFSEVKKGLSKLVQIRLDEMLDG